VETPHTQVIARIGFAERWLHRAKAQCADGDVAGGLMTLSLADAEMRVALEAAGWPMPRLPVARPAIRRWGPWVMVATAAALVLVWTLRPSAEPVGAALIDGPPVVRFSSVGTMLSLVSVTPVQSAPLQAARLDAQARTQRTAARTLHRVGVAPLRRATAVAVPTVTSPITHAARPLTIAAPSVPVPNLAAPFVLSEVDLIEMVLAANQALRGSGP